MDKLLIMRLYQRLNHVGLRKLIITMEDTQFTNYINHELLSMELRFGGEGCAVREKRNMIKLRKIIQKKN